MNAIDEEDCDIVPNSDDVLDSKVELVPDDVANSLELKVAVIEENDKTNDDTDVALEDPLTSLEMKTPDELGDDCELTMDDDTIKLEELSISVAKLETNDDKTEVGELSDKTLDVDELGLVVYPELQIDEECTLAVCLELASESQLKLSKSVLISLELKTEVGIRPDGLFEYEATFESLTVV